MLAFVAFVFLRCSTRAKNKDRQKASHSPNLVTFQTVKIVKICEKNMKHTRKQIIQKPHPMNKIYPKELNCDQSQYNINLSDLVQSNQRVQRDLFIF